jgi:hypothetical protein
MKKNYLIVVLLTLSSVLSSQSSSNKLIRKHEFKNKKINSSIIPQSRGLELWSSEFDTAGHWSITSSGTDPTAWTISSNPTFNSSIQAGTPFTDFLSATASNGFLYIDSDGAGGTDGDGLEIITKATLNTPIDLSGEPKVVLTFSHNYRWWQDTRGVRVSGDGGVNWTTYQLTCGANDPGNCIGCGANDNYPNLQDSENPEITKLDISSVAGNQSNVLIEFYYQDNDFWAWYWVVDDVKISRKDNNNIENQAAWIWQETHYGAEYGRTPITQVGQNWVVGAQVSNDGVNTQNNVTLNADFGSFVSSDSIPLLEPDSSRAVESLESLNLAVGQYQGTYTVKSDSDDVTGPNFLDNTNDRNFEITTDIFSLDGIGNHPAGTEILGSLGSSSFTGVEDGLICATMYPFINNDTVNSVRALITSATVANSEVILFITDSLSFTTGLFGNSIFISDVYTVTSQDVANGYIEIPVGIVSSNGQLFESLEITPGNYYFGLQLTSGGGTNNIGIIDDETIGQPGFSSAIWYPNDPDGIGYYSNGVAFAIRLNLGDNTGPNTTGIIENNNTISIYPNPSNGEFNIAASSNELSDLTVKDITGKIVISKFFSYNTIVNLNNYAKGVYVVEIKNKKGIFTQKIFLQ